MNKLDPKRPAGYEDDFALWTAEQAALLRAGRLAQVDIENVAEEIESLGRSDRYQIESRLEVLLAHLLKWEFQPDKRSNSWKATIFEQRKRIGSLLADSPSLRPFPATVLESAFVLGRNQAITETNLPETAFPATCPYTVEQVLDPNFLPGSAT